MKPKTVACLDCGVTVANKPGRGRSRLRCDEHAKAAQRAYRRRWKVTRLQRRWYAKYLRETANRITAVRQGVADALEGGSDELLKAALSEAFGDGEAWVYVEAMERTWREGGDPILVECAAILRDTRSEVWNTSLNELES